MTFVSELEPTQLWKHFDKILTIPRGSKNEEQMARYVISIAEKHGLSYQRDAAGNLVVRKPAAEGCESAAATALQCHLDMVNEKNADVEHDFTRDPIRPRRNDGYLTADGTTLGSDNGIGVAAALALMEDKTIKHGPLEFLFTVDEETGLTGASNLQPGFLQARQLINMDTEEEGALYVGCAGGAGVDLTLPLRLEAPPTGAAFVQVRLSGLQGGHSGVDIHLQRGNAVKLLARALNAARSAAPLRVVAFSGGNMHNAIPREAFAGLCVAAQSADALKSALASSLEKAKKEFSPVEPDMEFSLESGAAADRVFSEDSTATAIRLIAALPHGVMSMSYAIPELVETSSNLATVRTEGDRLKIHVSNRSSVDSALEALQQRVGAIGELAGAAVKYGEGYPGWQPDLNSRTLKAAKTVFRGHFGKDPEVKAVHAGLECGLIGEKYPGMDMVSFGPQIEYPHSPAERVRIKSVAEFYTLLSATLEELAK